MFLWRCFTYIKKTRNHEMVSREWSVECSSKFPLISIRLPLLPTSDVPVTASVDTSAAFSTVDDSVFAIPYPSVIAWRSTDADSYSIHFILLLICVSCACRIFYKIARTGERVRRMAYVCFSNAITCACFFIKKHAQANECAAWCE